MQATPSTNESIWLVGCFSHLPLDHTSHNEHQRVIKTRWWPLPLPRRLHQAPMSHYDSLVAFFTSPSTTLATMSTNESLWLIGTFFHLSFDHAGHNWHQRVIMTCWCFFSLLLDHAGYNWHQQVITTRWCLFSLIPRPCRPQWAPMNHWCLFLLLPQPHRP